MRTTLCRQIASRKWFLKKRNELYLKDSRRFVPHRRLYLRVLGNRSSSNSSSNKNISESASSRTRKLVQRVQREEQGHPTDNPELRSARKLERSAESLVEMEEPDFKVDLRIEGVAHNVILKDVERMLKNKTEVVENEVLVHTRNLSLRSGKTRKLFLKFSEESSRIIRELGQQRIVGVGTDIQHRPVPFMLETHASRIHLVFLWRLSLTWWRNNKKEKNRFQALIVPYCFARVNRSRGKKHGETQWLQDHWKAMDARRGAWKHNRTPS